MRVSRGARIAALSILAMAVASCETTAPAVVITITPGDVELQVGSAQQFTAIGGSGVVWSTDDPDVASVVPQTGFVTALERGTAEITAEAGDASASVTVTVLAPATIALSQPSVAFQSLVGANPASQNVQVTNAGDGAISNLVVGAIEYGAGEIPEWLTAVLSGTSAPATLTLTPDASGLPRGTYTASVPVVAVGIVNSPQYVAITLIVSEPASIQLTRVSVPMSGIPGVQIVETVGITNGGDIPLTGLSAAITYAGAPGQGWLTATILPSGANESVGDGVPPIAGDFAPAVLTLTGNTTGLAPGARSATVRILSSVPGVVSRDVAVQLTVVPGPFIQLSQTNLVLNATAGFNPQASTVSVTNGGGGTLSGLALGAIVYGLGQTPGWLSPGLSGTTAPATLTLNINSAALPPGTYNATLPILSPVATNSPTNVTVTLTVGTAPTMLLSRTAVTMSGLPGVNIVELVTITSSAAQIAGLSRTIAYQVGQPQGWLAATFNFATTPSTLTLTGSTGVLAPGVYNATVTVSSTTIGVASRNITVQLTVVAGPSIALSPNPAAIAVDYGSNPPPFIVNVSNGGGGALTGLTVGAVVYGTGNGWLSRVLSSANAPATVTLNVASSALASGNYAATVPVLSPVAGNSPQNIAVNLTVRAAPVIALNPSGTIIFGAWGNAAALPGQQVVQVTNSGGSTLNGLLTSTQYLSGNGWLNVTFSGGTAAPTSVVLRPSTTALNAGTYTAVVTLTSSAPGVVQRTINVTYTVQTFTTSLFPFFGPAVAGCGGCHDSGIRPPVYSATALTYYNNLGPYVISGNPSGSTLVCKIFGACSHGGGKFTSIAGFQAAVTSWINGGKPFR